MDIEGPAVKIQNESGVSTLHSDQSCPGTLVRLDSRTDTDPLSVPWLAVVFLTF